MAKQFNNRIDTPTTSLGTGDNRQIEIVTAGRRRFRVRSTEPVIEAELVDADPAMGQSPGWFFRKSGDKQQFCVRFSSGAIQIVATEP